MAGKKIIFSYEKFEELLTLNNVTSYKVAEETGLSRTLFSDWKSGKSRPKVDKIVALAKYFDVDIQFFLVEIEDGD